MKNGYVTREVNSVDITEEELEQELITAAEHDGGN